MAMAEKRKRGRPATGHGVLVAFRMKRYPELAALELYCRQNSLGRSEAIRRLLNEAIGHVEQRKYFLKYEDCENPKAIRLIDQRVRDSVTTRFGSIA